MKTSELSGAILDFWVAVAEGKDAKLKHWGDGDFSMSIRDKRRPQAGYRVQWSPSTIWSIGGHLIERDRIGVMPSGTEWAAWPCGEMVARGTGETALIAAMRAKVWSHYGDEIPGEAME